MPIYEYRCNDCQRRVSIFWRSFSESDGAIPRCPRCHGTNLVRLISRVTVLRSEESRLDALTDPAGLDESDPKSLARLMRSMSSETGEDLGPEFDEVVDRLESGQSPDDIEQAMPDLGSGDITANPDF